MSLLSQKRGVARGKLLQSVLAALGSSSPGKIQSEQPSVQAEAPALLCICNRKIQDILCRSCGYVFSGRVRKKCPLHTNEIHLMDASCCPKCETTHLLECGVNKVAEEEMAIRDAEITNDNDIEGTYDDIHNISVSRQIMMERKQLSQEVSPMLHTDGPEFVSSLPTEDWENELDFGKRE